MPTRARAAFLALAACSLAPSLRAQVVREKVAVEVLTLRVTARDRSGRSVDDLTRDDFSLAVDGQPVSIDTLIAPSVAISREPPAEAAAAVTAPETAFAPVPRVRTLVFADEGETRSLDRRPVYEQLEQFLRTEVPGARREIMVVRFDGGRAEIPCPWTPDADHAIESLRALRKAPAANRMPSAGDLPGSGTPEIWIETYMERMHRALLEAIAEFPDDPSLRQLLVVSGGTTLLRPGDLAAILRSEITEPQRNRLRGLDADVSSAHARELDRATFALWSRAVNASGDVLTMSDVVAKAMERDIGIIPVAAEPIDAGLGLGMERKGPSSAAARFTPRLGVAQSMTEIAENTGAEPILVPGRTRELLTRIESRPAYTLTFRDPARDHRYHRVELAARRRGVTLGFRRGYRIPNEDERMLDAAVARLSDAAGARSVGADPLNARAQLSGEPGEKTARLAIRFEPPREATPGVERGVDVVGVGEDSSGRRTEPISWSGTARAVDDEPGVYGVTTRLGVRVGDFRRSLAVRDADTGLISYVLIPAIR